MKAWWADLDRILRGEATRLPGLRRGTIETPVGGLSVVLAILAMSYGACMGCFALFKGAGPSYMQVFASIVKVPLLFALTLAVTFPSLYVFNALMGSRLTPRSVARLLLTSLAVIVAVLASLGPIVAFFSVSTASYPFMVLLNVAVFAVSGVLGLSFLLQTLHRLSLVRPLPAPTEADELVGDEKPCELEVPHPGALDPIEDQVPSGRVKAVFRCWVILFGLVGAQMGWVLRPFLGNPAIPFTWFRARESSFFEAVWLSLQSVLS
ncbi:hypothetical protein EP7_002398 [Isosphaeraceae bacterium EP7]